jgi:hypothetical protein
MTKIFAILMLLFATGSLAACASSGGNGADAGHYVGLFDNDENRPPMLGWKPPPQSLVYGDGQH